MEQDKEFKDFLKKIIEQNKVLIASDIVQTKTERDSLKLQIQEVKVEDQKIEKSLDQSKKLLEKIEKHLSASGEVYKKTNDKIISKLDNLSKIQDPKFQKVVRDDKDTRPLTMREILKGTVASAKSLGSNVGSSARNIFSGIKEAVTSPIKTLDKAHAAVSQKVGGIVEATKDVFSTEAGTMVGTIEGERFAKARKSSGIEYDDKSLQRGKQVYSAKKFKEQQIEDIREREAIQQTYGQTLSKKDQARLKTLQQEHGEVDLSPVTIDGKTISGKDQRKLLKNRRENQQRAGTFLQESPVQKEAEKAVEAKRQENPEADNIRSSQEVIADNSKEDLNLTKELLDTTKESVTILKDIRQSLADQIQPLRTKEQPVAPTQGTEVASGPGLGDLASSALDLGGDLLGRNKGKPGIPKPAGKPSLGGRIMGGIKNLGGNIFKAAGGLFSAGGAVAAATTIGGGLALNYGLTKGADAITEAAGADTNVTPEMEAQDEANWNKASFGEKLQSGLARGVEHIGGFLGADKTVAAAKAARIKSESEYLKNKEAEAKPAETVSGFSASARARWDRKEENIRRVNEETKAGTYKTEAGAQGLTKQQADQISEKDLFGGLTKEQYQFATQKVNGKYKNEMIDESGKEITDEKKRLSAMKKAVGQIQDLNEDAGKKDVTAKMGADQVSAMQPAAAESPDLQFDRDIKEHRARVSQAQKEGSLAVEPVRRAPNELSDLSVQYNDNVREASQSSPTPAPIIMNNSSNNSTTKVMPMKADPRPSSRGSALDRHIDRVSTY